ncbi:hypothetical protein [Lactobacillus sp. A27]|uniref:hypothetical protein n=1 Tax=Lactobacillus sp. A27 TaxID=2796363 RepID=UPI00191D5FE5|nr:hypothetical protein [Lactobacillus sp. A27]MBL1059489.1 hypothetical protein [Lactobacillus sp. A27]
MEIIDREIKNSKKYDCGDVIRFWNIGSPVIRYGLVSKALDDKYAITMLDRSNLLAGNITADGMGVLDTGIQGEWYDSIEELRIDMAKRWDHVDRVDAVLIIKNLGDDDE